MIKVLFLFISIYGILAEASFGPWRKVELVEVVGDRCEGALCVSEGKTSLGIETTFSEYKKTEKGFEKREVLKLLDTSEICRGASQSVSKFYSFETRDLDKDGKKDPLVLIRAGKLKRKDLKEGECRTIGTAIYEVGFRNGLKELEWYEPSYPILQRLAAMEALLP